MIGGEVPDGFEVDHRNNKKYDNTRENLRICTHLENQRNRKVQDIYAKKRVSSQFKGVTWKKKTDCWCVQLSNGEQNLHLGLFSNEVAGANCYNYYALKYFGEFAKLNICPYMKKEEWEKFRIQKNKTSKYRGVSFVENKWVAQIWNGKRNLVLGRYDNEIEAVIAYNNKAIELKGDKAKINII